MRVRLDRYETANRSMATKTTILFILGGIGVVIAAFGFFLGFAMLAMPDKHDGDGIWAHRGGIFLSVFFGLIPAVVSTLFIWYGVRQRGRFRRLGELAAVARQSPLGLLSTPDVARGLGTTPQLAERLIIDATRLGLIDHSAPAPPMATGANTLPPAPHYSQHHVVVAAAGVGSPLTPTVASGGQPPAAAHESPNAPAAPAPPAHAHAASDEIVRQGSILGDTYRIEEPLGRGGMGEVFAARHLRTGRRYAVKSILRGGHKRDDEAAFRRFEREATAASALGHPGIVQVHDFNVTSSGTFYLVMDLLEGETLEQRLEKEKGALAWPEAQRIALELCSALAAAHEHELIHRDIKPSNVFLAKSKLGQAPLAATSSREAEPSERVVLVDFGLVKPLAESGSLLTSTGAVVGTPMYMSPEQARGEPLDVRSDVYSVAAVIFETTAGSPPFLDRTLAAVYARLLNEPAPRASQVAKRRVPRALDDVLARALSKDRAQRYPDVRALRDAIAQIQGQMDEDGPTGPTTERMVN